MANFIRITEGRYAGDFLIAEGNGDISRDTVVLGASQDLEAGAVLGTITATGQYVEHDPAATDGSETASGILWDNAKTGAGETVKVAVVSRMATVRASGLNFKTGMSEAEKAAALADLETNFIIAR